MFAIVTSDAKDYQNKARGFRYVIFDLFGTVLDRNPASVDREFFSSSKRATDAMWKALNEIDALEVTRKGIERERRNHESEMQRVHRDMEALVAKGFAKDKQQVPT